MDNATIVAVALGGVAIYSYSQSPARKADPATKSKQKAHKGAPYRGKIPPGCLPSPNGGPPICPPKTPGTGVSTDPFLPLKPFHPPSPPTENPLQPLKPVPGDPDDGWRKNTSAYPSAGCFINRKYNPTSADPWSPASNGALGLGWTPEMVDFATEPAACIANEKALAIARKYNNAGLADNDLLTYKSSGSCVQWKSDTTSPSGGSLQTIACLPLIPMGPVGHEYPQPQPPPPPKPPAPPAPPTPPPPFQPSPISKALKGYLQIIGFNLYGTSTAQTAGQTLESCATLCNADKNCQFAVFNNDLGVCETRIVPAHKNQTTQLRTVDAYGHDNWTQAFPGGLKGWDLQKSNQPDQASCTAFCASAWGEAVYPGQPDKWAAMAMYDSGDKKCFCKKAHPDQKFTTLIKQVN